MSEREMGECFLSSSIHPVNGDGCLTSHSLSFSLSLHFLSIFLPLALIFLHSFLFEGFHQKHFPFKKHTDTHMKLQQDVEVLGTESIY